MADQPVQDAGLERAVEATTSALIDAEFYPPMFAEKVARLAVEAAVAHCLTCLSAIVGAAREFLLPIEHAGPCVNYEDQIPEWYDKYDSCSRHLRAAAERRELLAEALQQYDGGPIPRSYAVDRDDRESIGEPRNLTGSSGTICRCGHPKSEHRDYESGNKACAWPGCSCTQYDGDGCAE